VRLVDCRRLVVAVVRDELAPRHVGPAVVRRRGVVVRDDPFLVVEQLRLAEVAADAVVDHDRLQPGEAAVRGGRHEQVAVTRLGSCSVLARVAEGRVDRRPVFPVEDSDRIAADLQRLLDRHVPGRPRLPAVERRVVLVATRAVVVRARDHVQRVCGIDLDVRLVVRKWVVAVEIRVGSARGRRALVIPVRSVLLVIAGDVRGSRPFLRHAALRKRRACAHASGQYDAEHRHCRKQQSCSSKFHACLPLE
jgi:hypothetical protein